MSEVDRARNTLEMRSSLIVLGSREGVSELELKNGSLSSDLEHDQCKRLPT